METLEEFLKNYDDSKYKHPSVTCDIVIFTLNKNNELCLVLIKRKNHPFIDKWALPGGFINIDESLDDAARRELFEETNIKDLPITQFMTFGDLNRDPRTRVISVAYMAFVPKCKLDLKAKDDAKDAKIFVLKDNMFVSDDEIILPSDLAFDHEKIITTALLRLKNRIDYTMDAFDFLQDENAFTILELKKIYEAVTKETLDTANFRRDFIKKYVNKGIVEKTNLKAQYQGRAASLYRRIK